MTHDPKVKRNKKLSCQNDLHPNGQVGNDPPGAVLGHDGNLRLGWVSETLNVSGHLFGFLQDLLEGIFLDVVVSAAHGLGHEVAVAELVDIGEEVVDDGLVVRHGG